VHQFAYPALTTRYAVWRCASRQGMMYRSGEGVPKDAQVVFSPLPLERVINSLSCLAFTENAGVSDQLCCRR
jgi:hypothetical protein